MLYKPIRVTLRLTKGDVDIISLMEYYRPRYIVSLAVSRYLGQTDETLPLPPESSEKEALYRSIIFHRGDDEETYDFLASLPEGAVSPVLKRLIRHATAQCDIRPLLVDAGRNVKMSVIPSIRADVSNIGQSPRVASTQFGEATQKKKKRRRKHSHPADAAQMAVSQAGRLGATPPSAKAVRTPSKPKPQPSQEPEEEKPRQNSIFDLI